MRIGSEAASAGRGAGLNFNAAAHHLCVEREPKTKLIMEAWPISLQCVSESDGVGSKTPAAHLVLLATGAAKYWRGENMSFQPFQIVLVFMYSTIDQNLSACLNHNTTPKDTPQYSMHLTC